MPIIASAKAGGDFKPCPAGVHDAICVFVEDIGFEHNEEWNKEIHKIYIGWEINEPMDDGRPFMITKKYTLSLSDKAALRKDLEGWRGVNFTEDQLKGFDVEVLVGKQCQIQVIHKEFNGKVYANIQAILPKGKNSPKMTVVSHDVPEWILKIKDANELRTAQLDSAPVVVTGVEEPKRLVPGKPAEDEDEPPF